MKTVVENNVNTSKHYPISRARKYPSTEGIASGRSCFYDFGAKSLMEFSGFSEDVDSAFIDEVMAYFQL